MNYARKRQKRIMIDDQQPVPVITREEIIGWSITSPMIMGYLVLGSNIYGIHSKFKLMFTSTHAKLPAITTFFYSIGDFATSMILTVLVFTPLMVVIYAKSNRAKVVVPVIYA